MRCAPRIPSPFLSLSLSHFGSSRVLERRSTIPPGIFRDLATETTGGTRKKKKKKEKNFESTDLGLRARWGSRLVSAWFDPWKWLSGIELSIDEDLMLAGRIDFSLPLFLLSTLRKYTCTRGRGEEGLFLLCPANEKLGNNPRVAGEIFNSILCSNLGSLTERRYIKGEIYAEVFSDGKPVFFTASD